jgi:hypothetical protein
MVCGALINYALGARGVGKSASLNQTVLHARRNGWLVLFLPDGWSQVHDGSYVQPALLERSTGRNLTNQLRFNPPVPTDGARGVS